MIFNKLSANWKLAATSNRFLLVANLLLSAALLVSVQAALSNRERITITPPTIDKPYTIGWNSATPEYFKSMGLYFSGVIGMVGPKNLAYVTSVVERFAAPHIAEGIKTKLRMQASTYEFRNSTSSAWFEARDISWEEQTRKVFVPGVIHSISSNKQEITQPVVYEYVIDVVEGKPVITDFDSYEGDQPHSLVYLSDKKRAEADLKRREEAMRQSLGDFGVTPQPLPAGAQQGGAK